MAQIHLLGTVHDDPLGSRRIKKALKREKPSVITLETSDEFMRLVDKGIWLEAMEKRLQGYVDRGLSDRVYEVIRSQIHNTYNYELKEAREFARKKGIPFHCIDDPKAHKRNIEEILRANNSPIDKINQFSIEDVTKNVEFWYTRARKVLAWKREGYDPEEQRIINFSGMIDGTRDEVPARYFRELAKDKKGKIIHVCGLAHMMLDSFGRSLYSKISDLKPTRSTIADYGI